MHVSLAGHVEGSGMSWSGIRLSQGPAIRMVAAATVVLAALLWAPCARAQAGKTLSETEAKAGFLLNFARFTEWPVSTLGPTDPIVICVTDQDVATELTRTIGTRKVGEHPVSALVVKLGDAPRHCSILYAHRLDDRKTSELLSAVGALPVLTVSDSKAFAGRGGAVQLFLSEGRMLFNVNRQSAERSRLRLSSKLLGLSRPVED